jgi:hypothetical protein
MHSATIRSRECIAEIPANRDKSEPIETSEMPTTMEAAMSDDLAPTPSTPSRSVIPTDLNALLPRDVTATALTEAGYPISKATLATMASRGGGPPYQMWGPRVIYRWALRSPGRNLA